MRLEIKVQLWLQLKSFEFHFVENIQCNITLSSSIYKSFFRPELFIFNVLSDSRKKELGLETACSENSANVKKNLTAANLGTKVAENCLKYKLKTNQIQKNQLKLTLSGLF